MTNINKENNNQPRNRPHSNKSGRLVHKYALFFVLCIILIGAILAYGSSRTQKQTEQQIAGFDETFQNSEVLLSNKNYDEALQVWRTFIEHQTDPEEESKGHLGLASVYMNKQDYAAALASYQRSEQLSAQPKQSIYNGVITIASINNNKTLEIEYNRKAIEALDKNHPLYEADKASYERRIEELNAKTD